MSFEFRTFFRLPPAASPPGLLLAAICCLLVVGLSGCGGSSGGPKLGTVKGSVTLNGEPLAAAVVTFHPVNVEGTYSTARTDASGNYELIFSRQSKGALVAEHRVTISTGGDGDEEDEEGNPISREERVPAQYNTKSELVRQVEPGANVINFELTGTAEQKGAAGKTSRSK